MAESSSQLTTVEVLTKALELLVPKGQHWVNSQSRAGGRMSAEKQATPPFREWRLLRRAKLAKRSGDKTQLNRIYAEYYKLLVRTKTEALAHAEARL